MTSVAFIPHSSVLLSVAMPPALLASSRRALYSTIGALQPTEAQADIRAAELLAREELEYATRRANKTYHTFLRSVSGIHRGADNTTKGRSLSEGATCDCDYHAGGCTISKVAPSGQACHCQYEGAWTCSGQVVPCSDNNAYSCQNPSKDISSCFQGGGDCGGYSASCDCDYHPGGCKISKVAPQGTACHCSFKGAWTCGGSVAPCRTPYAAVCTNPDKSYASCAMGGGDCGGY